jgi:tetratricopeptide (TPR) repeat protein
MMEVGPLDHEIPAVIALDLYVFGLMDEGDRYLQRAIAIAPDKDFLRATKLYRLVLLGDYARARELSESMLRDDIEDRWSAYRVAVMVFMSTMSELDKTDEALAVLEELRPGISSPDYQPSDAKEMALQYSVVLALAQSKSIEETRSMLNAVVPRWNEFFPLWRDALGAAPIVMARGQTKLAVELAIEDLDHGWNAVWQWPWMVNRYIDYYKDLAQEPAVAERLAELDAEAKRAGEDIWAYIVENDLQL